MLKRTLVTFTFVICGFMNLQATTPDSFSQPVEINQENEEQELACSKCGNKNKRHLMSLTSDNILVGCPKCKDKRLA